MAIKIYQIDELAKELGVPKKTLKEFMSDWAFLSKLPTPPGEKGRMMDVKKGGVAIASYLSKPVAKKSDEDMVNITVEDLDALKDGVGS